MTESTAQCEHGRVDLQTSLAIIGGIAVPMARDGKSFRSDVVVDGQPEMLSGKLTAVDSDTIREYSRIAWSATRARMEV